jgi:chorismate mutase
MKKISFDRPVRGYNPSHVVKSQEIWGRFDVLWVAEMFVVFGLWRCVFLLVATKAEARPGRDADHSPPSSAEV